jgi:glyoxylase-like metal-dependent hydrolase (beta-lactamase superfamily II)
MVRFSRHGEVLRIDLARSILGRGRYWTTAYMVGPLLVDSGCAHTANELVAGLNQKGLRPEILLNTHSHEDHIGGNAAITRTFSDIRVLAHPEALMVMADPRGRQPEQPYRRLFWGWPEPSSGTPIREGDTIDAGELQFRVIETPGHSPDHLCLFEPDRGWLFSGDLYVGGRDRALRSGSDIGGVISSLERVAALPVITLFPGSARIPEDPAATLAAKIAWLRSIRDRVLALHAQGLGVGRIAREAFGPPMGIELLTLGHFSRRWLVRSILASEGS